MKVRSCKIATVKASSRKGTILFGLAEAKERASVIEFLKMAITKSDGDERAATSNDSANVERLPYVGRVRRMRRSQLPDDTVELAQFLVGKLLIRDHRAGRTSGRIVETEAYPVGDAAGHAYFGMTMANRSLFLAKGHAYVYFIYGSSYMCNVSAERKGIGAGVLLRALQPLEGIPLMQRRRRTVFVSKLAKGPGRLAAAMAIDRHCDGIDLCAPGSLWLGGDESLAMPVTSNIRIGLTREIDRPLRFYERSSAWVSGPRKLRE